MFGTTGLHLIRKEEVMVKRELRHRSSVFWILVLGRKITIALVSMRLSGNLTRRQKSTVVITPILFVMGSYQVDYFFLTVKLF